MYAKNPDGDAIPPWEDMQENTHFVPMVFELRTTDYSDLAQARIRVTDSCLGPREVLMKCSVVCTVLGGMLMYCSTAAAIEREADIHMCNLYESDGDYVVVGWKAAADDAIRKAMTRQIRFPEQKRVPVGTITHLEKISEYAETLRTYPELTERQRGLDTTDPGELTERQRGLDTTDPGIHFRFKDTPPTPLYQMFDRCLGLGPFSKECYVVDASRKPAKIALGPLLLPPYRFPPTGVARPYEQPTADLVKPLLFRIDGQYYSVYGDCQVAKHVPVDGVPEALAAFRYAGNPLYACSQELPPWLQSCGADTGGVIWLADGDGHIAFFRTRSLDFIQRCITVAGSARVLIPRDNRSHSVFALNTDKAVFEEYHVDPAENIGAPANAVDLPDETQYVLFSDASQVVYLTGDKALACVRHALNKEKCRSVALNIGRTQKVWEGLYLDRKDEVVLLVGDVPQLSKEHPELSKLAQTRKSWDDMQLLVVPLSPDEQQ